MFWFVSFHGSVKLHPTVESGCPFFAAAAWLDSHGVSHFLDGVAQAYFLLDEEPRKTNTVGLVFGLLVLVLVLLLFFHAIFPPV
jgi:hypothetical protein